MGLTIETSGMTLVSAALSCITTLLLTGGLGTEPLCKYPPILLLRLLWMLEPDFTEGLNSVPPKEISLPLALASRAGLARAFSEP